MKDYRPTSYEDALRAIAEGRWNVGLPFGEESLHPREYARKAVFYLDSRKLAEQSG